MTLARRRTKAERTIRCAPQVALRSDVMPSRSDKKVRRSEMMAHPLRAKGLLDPEGIENMEVPDGLSERRARLRRLL